MTPRIIHLDLPNWKWPAAAGFEVPRDSSVHLLLMVLPP